MVKLSQALRPDELKGLQGFSRRENPEGIYTKPLTGEQIPPDDIDREDPVLDHEVLDGNSLVEIIEHIDYEIHELIGTYSTEIYRPRGELSSFSDESFSLTDKPPLSQEDKKPMWYRYITYQKYLVQRLSTFKLRIMEAECWFDEQGYIDQKNLLKRIKMKDPSLGRETSPEEVLEWERFLEDMKLNLEKDSWLPEREQDDYIR